MTNCVLPGGWILPEDLRDDLPVRSDPSGRAVVSVVSDPPDVAGAVGSSGTTDGAGWVLPRPRRAPDDARSAAEPLDSLAFTAADDLALRIAARGSWTAPPPRPASRPAPSTAEPAGAEPPTDADERPRTDAEAARRPDPGRVDPSAQTHRIGWKRPAFVAAAATTLLVGVGGPTFGAGSKELTVTIDGASQPVTTTLESVGDVLAHAGVVVGSHDTVTPALSAPVQGGTAITIDRARLVSVTVNGEHRQAWTKADTVADAVRALGIDPGSYRLSRDPADALSGSQTVALTAQQLHSTKLIDGANRPVSLRTVASTVGELLAAQGIRLGELDRVTPSADTPLSDGQRIVVTRTTVTEKTSTRSIPAPKATVVVDSNLGKGLTKTVPGKRGVRTVVTRFTTVNDATSKKVIADKVTTPAVAPKKIVGAKETGDPVSWSVPWDKMAMCESSGRWDLGYGMAGAKGGLQFLTSTWRAFGGGEFAPSANQATKNQQIIVAERLYAKQGLAPWACARILGWGFDKYTGPLPGRP